MYFVIQSTYLLPRKALPYAFGTLAHAYVERIATIVCVRNSMLGSILYVGAKLRQWTMRTYLGPTSKRFYFQVATIFKRRRSIFTINWWFFAYQDPYLLYTWCNWRYPFEVEWHWPVGYWNWDSVLQKFHPLFCLLCPGFEGAEKEMMKQLLLGKLQVSRSFFREVVIRVVRFISRLLSSKYVRTFYLTKLQ